MPKYAITVQRNVSPDAPARAVRSASSQDLAVIDVEAANITDALLTLNVRLAQGTATPPRVVTVEEVLVVDTTALTDDRIAHALEHAPVPVSLDDRDDEVIVEAVDFGSVVGDVATALHDAALVPGLTVSILRDENGVFDYAMVEIHDQATGTYRSVGRDPGGLIAERSLTGRAGILSVARTLIEIVAFERLL